MRPAGLALWQLFGSTNQLLAGLALLLAALYLLERRRRAWLAVRDPRFSPVEQELGALLDELHRGLAPELRDEVWFSSFLSCLIVCERHFEERARLGADRASNGELVALQWAPVLAAAEALGALADVR
jgi:hypothetical protein